MLSTVDDWTKALYENTDVDIVDVGFCKAFNKVPFKEPFPSFKLLVFRIVKWVKTFITNRSFQVTVNENSSSITSEVPQGAVCHRFSSSLIPTIFLSC